MARQLLTHLISRHEGSSSPAFLRAETNELIYGQKNEQRYFRQSVFLLFCGQPSSRGKAKETGNDSFFCFIENAVHGKRKIIANHILNGN